MIIKIYTNTALHMWAKYVKTFLGQQLFLLMSDLNTLNEQITFLLSGSRDQTIQPFPHFYSRFYNSETVTHRYIVLNYGFEIFYSYRSMSNFHLSMIHTEKQYND